MSISGPLFGDMLDNRWVDDAACRGVDNDLFFSLDEDDQRQALELCRDCPVQQECLRYAIEEREVYGIWGGMREADRRSLIRDHRRAQRQQRQTTAA